MDKMPVGEQASKGRENANKTKYTFISYDMRKELIRQVKEDKISIYRASRNVGIKNCTAKAIIRQFKKRGHVYRRKQERKRKKKNSNQNVENVDQVKVEEQSEVNISHNEPQQPKIQEISYQNPPYIQQFPIVYPPCLWIYPFLQ